MSLEDDILKLGFENPLPDDRMRSLLKRTLETMRRNHPEDFEAGRSDDEIIEEAMQKRKELAFVSGVIRKTEPRFTHDCDRCRWLGQFEQVDLWWCPSPSSKNLDSVIGRYGSDGPAYAASHPPAAFADPAGYLRTAERWYREALKRAEAAGLYQPPGRAP